MRKTIFSFLTVAYVLLMLSASVGAEFFGTSKKSVQINWSNCEDLPSDNEEPTTEDSREFDENIKLDVAFGAQTVFLNSSKKISVYLHSTGLHFPEIDSPPPQA